MINNISCEVLTETNYGTARVDYKVKDNTVLSVTSGLGGDYTIFDDRKKQISIVQEFNFICNKRKIYFLGLCYHVGKFFGSCLSYLFVDRLGRKIPLIIFIPISIALMACFKFLFGSTL